MVNGGILIFINIAANCCLGWYFAHANTVATCSQVEDKEYWEETKIKRKC